MAKIHDQADYDRFQKKHDDLYKTEGFYGLIPGRLENEFSVSRCDICDDRQGGPRYTVTGATLRPGNHSFIVCIDCYHYAAFGQLDDQTMLDLDLNP